MTIIDCCISLKMIKTILVVLGVVDMCQLLLSTVFMQLEAAIRLRDTIFLVIPSGKSQSLDKKPWLL